MKRIIAVLCVVCFLFAVIGCGQDMVIKGKMKRTIGIFNLLNSDSSLGEVKDPQVQYRVIWGNVLLACLLVETIIAPIYFFGFSLWEPVGEMEEPTP